MSQQYQSRLVARSMIPPAEGERRGEPTLAEDLLLLLFQPKSGMIIGENTLCYALAGAVLAELTLVERVTSTVTRQAVTSVQAVNGLAPEDNILRAALGLSIRRTPGGSVCAPRDRTEPPAAAPHPSHNARRHP